MCYYPSNNSWSDTPADPPEGMGDGASMVWTGGDSLYVLRGEFEGSYHFMISGVTTFPVAIGLQWQTSPQAIIAVAAAVSEKAAHSST